MSSRHRGLRALALGGLAALMVAAFGAASAWAEPSTYCVKATKVTKFISGKTKHVFTGAFNDKGCTSVNATNEGKFDKLASFTAPEEAELKALLKYVKVQASGVDSKPTVQFSGANVQVVNGEGSTRSNNGEGNLVVGYDQAPRTQTGSHNLVLGEDQQYTSYGGIVAGFGNNMEGIWASITGGYKNTASAELASVSAGVESTAKGQFSTVNGGYKNVASGAAAETVGGVSNEALGEESLTFGDGLKVKNLQEACGGNPTVTC